MEKSKATLKKEVKSTIEGYIEKEMKEKQTPKMRSVTMGPFGRKSYLEGELTEEEVTKALKIKLHMVQAQANYGQKNLCEFCMLVEETTEHILLNCQKLQQFY